MKLKIICIAHHRNGVAGTPFDIVLFNDKGLEGSRKVAILFEEVHQCAVLDIAKLAAGDIAFGSNSWRGDNYEPHLRQAVATFVPDSRSPDLFTAITPSIRQRVRRIGHVLSWCGNGTLYENLIDLLADARHWCDRNARSYADLDRQAYQHYLAEIHQPERSHAHE